MNNFKAKRIFRRLMKILSFLAIVIVLLVMLVVLRLYVVSNQDEVNPQFTNGNLEIYMIDVGQGDSFVILQNNKVLLIDAGTMYNMNATNKALKELGVKKIDYAILTHYHQDHSAGLFSIMLNYKIDHMYVTDMSKHSEIKLDGVYYFIRTLTQIADHFSGGTMIELVKDSNSNFKTFQFADSYVEFFAPIEDEYDIVNNYSLVAKVTYGEKSILFTGDIESEVEQQLLESGIDLSADVYKAAHHGSMTSNTEAFMNAVNPEVVLISSDNGNHNSFGHPVQSFMEYLKEKSIRVYRTDESGTVRIIIDGYNVISSTSRDDYKSGTQVLETESESN